MAFPAVPAALAVAGATIGAEQARAQNAAIKRSMGSAQEAARVQSGQVNDQAAIELLKRRNEAAMIRARLRVSSAEAGTGSGFDTLLDQAGYDQALNEQILEINRVNENRAIQSGLQANLASLAAQGRNAILDAFAGGLQGLATGLQIVSLGQSLDQLGTIQPDSGDPLLKIGASGNANPNITVLPSYIGDAGA